jgi:UDP-3-O-[3-hydroxymyristoyl] glucosamine N-acyltransferase
MRIRDIVAALGGQCVGDDGLEVTAVNAVEYARPGEITFAAGPRFITAAEASGASAVVVPMNAAAGAKTFIKVPDVLAYTAGLIRLLHPESRPAPGIHPTAVVGEQVRLGERVAIGPHAVIDARAAVGDDCVIGPGVWIGEDCVVGDDTRIHANACLYPRTRVGRRCLIHGGAVLGADGFRFIPGAGGPQKVPQIGSVRVDDDVEIGANTCIDRAGFGVTHIQQSVKIDNLVQIGHNCVVGAGSVIAGQVGMAGSVRLGRGVMLGGQAGLADHVSVGDGVQVAGGSGVHTDIPAGERWAGYPAVSMSDLLNQVRLQRGMARIFDALRRMVDERAAGAATVEAAPKAAAGAGPAVEPGKPGEPTSHWDVEPT